MIIFLVNGQIEEISVNLFTNRNRMLRSASHVTAAANDRFSQSWLRGAGESNITSHAGPVAREMPSGLRWWRLGRPGVELSVDDFGDLA